MYFNCKWQMANKMHIMHFSNEVFIQINDNIFNGNNTT